LALDHDSARELGRVLGAMSGVRVVTPETNIVSIAVPGRNAGRVVEEARERGVLLNATGPDTLRAVTHLDVSLSDVMRAGERLCEAISATPEAQR
jgi:threonine aldolase